MREVKYLAHFGKKGQTWYVRNYQDYETVPTVSGKVGEFRGEEVNHDERKSEEPSDKSQNKSDISKKTIVEITSNKRLNLFKKAAAFVAASGATIGSAYLLLGPRVVSSNAQYISYIAGAVGGVAALGVGNKTKVKYRTRDGK